mmetsp:Transcript_121299/g.350278  ORF Transcript_121299/g.350278 Transcript_121299/m.350278 type:complete len:579 (-) Transcript_121299:82-1818(-)
MGALEAAVRALSGAGEKKKAFLDTMHQAQLLSVAADVRRVLSKDVTADKTSQRDLEVLRRFVDAPTDLAPAQASSVLQLSQSNNPFGDYAPQSTQIQGILKGLYDSFAADLEKDNAEEGEKQKSFEELMQTKEDEHRSLTETLKQHESDRAKKVKLLADGKTERDDTKVQLKADEEFFAATKKGCQQKAEDWSLRSSLRTEELLGINKALEILRDPKNAEVFNSAATTLVQLTATSHSRGAARRVASKAYARLSEVAARYGSLKLGRLATQVKVGGHFDKVMAAIDEMIVELRKEEQEDIDHRDRCEGGAAKNKNDMEDLNHNIKKAATEIDRLEGSIADVKKEIDGHRDDIKETEKELKEMLTLRNEEHEGFVRALHDDERAIKIVQSAIAALSKFYESKRLDSPSLVQKQEPEYTRDPDKAPETSWDTPDYAGEKSQTQGPLAALEMIVEDMEHEIEAGRKQEAEAQAQYLEERDKLREVKESLQKKKNDAEMRAAEMGERRDDTEEMKTQLKSELIEQQELAKTLELDCAWVEQHFDSRRKARKAEMEGLHEAKSILAGADAGDYDALSIEEAAK